MIVRMRKKYLMLLAAIIGLALCFYLLPYFFTQSVDVYDKEYPEVTISLGGNTDKQEMRAVWISYIELTPILKGKTEAEFKTSFTRMVSNIKNSGFNTVLVQVRPFADALYDSDYFPWSHLITGEQGKVPTFDPLKIMVECTHESGLAIQAWINPLRVRSSTSLALSADNQANKWYNSSLKGTYVVEVGNGLYYNPAYQDIVNLIVNGAGEIAAKYDIDGIHMDDYFYPTTDASFDAAAYTQYQSNKGELSLADWRLQNIDNLVKKIYEKIKSINSRVVFGISPQANVTNNYNQQYADVKLWMKETGYIDYICPQVYFGFNNEAAPFAQKIEEWCSFEKSDSVKLYIGLAAYKLGTEDARAGAGKDEWIGTTDLLTRMVMEIRSHKEIGGFALYSYKYFFEPTADAMTQVTVEKDNLIKQLK